MTETPEEIEAHLRGIEDVLGCALPAGYVAWIRSGETVEAPSLMELYSVAQSHKHAGPMWSPGYFPIADDAFGNYFVLNCHNNSVSYWHHDCADEDRIQLFRATLEIFLQDLRDKKIRLRDE